MLPPDEIKRMQDQPAIEDVTRLLSEVERLKNESSGFRSHISHRLDELESDMVRLQGENVRLIEVRDSAYVELDACVRLIAQLALGSGLTVGTVGGNQVVVDLPTGQVVWEYLPSEAYLFKDLPAYQGQIESIDIQEKYRRVMTAQFFRA